MTDTAETSHDRQGAPCRDFFARRPGLDAQSTSPGAQLTIANTVFVGLVAGESDYLRKQTIQIHTAGQERRVPCQANYPRALGDSEASRYLCGNSAADTRILIAISVDSLFQSAGLQSPVHRHRNSSACTDDLDSKCLPFVRPGSRRP